MDRPLSELEAQASLRNLEAKSKAQAILARPSEPKLLFLLGVVGATLVALFAFKGLNAPDVAVALLAGSFVGLVAICIELWSVRRRLESVIELIDLRDREQA